MKKIFSLLIIVAIIFSMTACNFKVNEETTEPIENQTTPTIVEQEVSEVNIDMNYTEITVDGQEITNDNTQAVYADSDIVFYLAEQDFTYGAGTEQDDHQQKEADEHTVVHITKPGTYILSGTIRGGQIAVDLGEDAKTNPDAIVTLVFNNFYTTCSVAPAVIFYNVYEPFNDVTEEAATKDVDTSAAGANIIIADGTENSLYGSYVAKIYQPESVVLNDDGTEVIESKTLHKYDGAIYSKMTMNINGGPENSGKLSLRAENEGIDSEMHLTINGGDIYIQSGNDGINTNKDNISVTTINGGNLYIMCDGNTGEGDGIDSNGWIVINGGSVTSQACSTSGDAGLDSDRGVQINGGSVMATGNMFDRIADGEQTYAVFCFATLEKGFRPYYLKNASNEVVGTYKTDNYFSYLIVSGDYLVEGDYTFWYGEQQLSASKSSNAIGGFGGVGGPNFAGPNFGEPETNINGAERPEMPNGNIPEGKPNPNQNNGERPERPGEEFDPNKSPDANRPEGNPPEMPEGQMPTDQEMQNPPNSIGDPNGFVAPGEPASEIFIINKGANYFIYVSVD